MKSKFQLYYLLALFMGVFWVSQDLVAQNSVLAEQDSFGSRVDWESLGFSADGRFYASITYGVEHESSESHFFARLQVQHLKGRSSELVLERLLRRSLPLSSARKISSRAIMLDLLGREARELHNFQIDSLIQGNVLLLEHVKEMQGNGREQEIKADRDLESSELTMPKLEMPDFEVEEPEIGMLENWDGPFYIARQNMDATVFYLRKIEMDGASALHGQLIVAQSGAFLRRYAFQQSWNSLLQKPAQDLSLEPVFASVSPDAQHLVLTLRAAEQYVSFVIAVN